MYDICIIGAGIIGCAIARELSKFNTSILLLDKAADVADGASKANSGIVHGGYDAKHGSIKAKFSAPGNALYDELAVDLNFSFSRCGSFVIGFNEEDCATIKSLYENGIKNHARGLKIVDGDFVRAKNPHLSDKITCALYCESAGIVSPYEMSVALAENAIDNGVSLKLNTCVKDITKQDASFDIFTNNGEYRAKIIINAAGLYSDAIAKMVGIDDFVIQPRQGQYLLFDKDQSYLANQVIFQSPTARGKGVLVTPTVHDNLLLGPTSEFIEDKNNVDTSLDAINYVIDHAKKTTDKFDPRKVITSFSGNRAHSNLGDFIIEESKISGFINVAGIESPGLTSAPAIAKYVVEIIKDTKIIDLTANNNFNPKRLPINHINELSATELNALIKQNPAYGRVICRCETISEGEIVEVLRRNIPITTMDAIKRRVRAGMGRCQGGFCSPKVLELIAQETGLNVEEIGKNTTITKDNKTGQIIVEKLKQL